MSIICFLPCSEIDWAATGAMIGGVGSIISALLLIYVDWRQTKKTREIEKANTEKECRISLFDKRYEIYDLVSRQWKKLNNKASFKKWKQK